MRLQKRIRDFLQRKRAVEEYLAICPPELSELDTVNVKHMLARYGPFVYSSEVEEEDMQFDVRE